jgi:CheY-like chemotaxis protein
MIVFVDDDKRYMKAYVETLCSLGYSALQECDVDKALALVIENHKNIDLLVLDMNIPPGLRLIEDKDNGTDGRRTGYWFLQEIRSIIGEITFPLMIFTHVSIESLSSDIDDFSSDLKSTPFQLIQKEEYTPYELAEQIKEMLKEVDNKNSVV